VSIACTLLAATIAACGSSASSGAASGASASGAAAAGATATPDPSASMTPATAASQASYDAAAFNLLPASVKSSKSIAVDVDSPNPPWTYYGSSNQLLGVTADLISATEKILGVTIAVNRTQQSTALTDIKAGRVGLVFDASGDTAARQSAGTWLDWVDSPTDFVTTKGNPDGLSGITSLCGKTIAVSAGGSLQPTLAAASVKYCTSAKLPAIKEKAYPNTSLEAPAVQSGQADALYFTLPQNEAIVSAAPNLFQQAVNTFPNGLPSLVAGCEFPLNSPLLPAFKLAFTDMMKPGGVYDAIMQSFDITQAEMSGPVINAATTQPSLSAAKPPVNP
jgi:polar amino acid transport system substrate-binding protein